MPTQLSTQLRNYQPTYQPPMPFIRHPHLLRFLLIWCLLRVIVLPFHFSSFHPSPPFPSSFLVPVDAVTYNRLPDNPPLQFSSAAITVELTARSFFAQTLIENYPNLQQQQCNNSKSNETVSLIINMGGVVSGTSAASTIIWLLPWPITTSRSNQMRWIPAPTIDSTQPRGRTSFTFVHSDHAQSLFTDTAFAFGGNPSDPVNFVTGSLWSLNLENTKWTPLGPSKMYDPNHPTGYECNGQPIVTSPGNYDFPPYTVPNVDNCWYGTTSLAQTDEFGCPWPAARFTQTSSIVEEAIYMLGGLIPTHEAVGDLWRLKLDSNLQLAINQQSTSVGGVYVYNADQKKFLANSSDPTINRERLCPVKWELLTRPDYTSSLINSSSGDPFPGPRWIASSTSSGPYFVIMGGFVSFYSTDSRDDIWLLDTHRLRWSKLATTPFTSPSPASRVYHALFAMKFTNIASYVSDPTDSAVVACGSRTVTALVIGAGISSIGIPPNDMYLLIPNCTATVNANMTQPIALSTGNRGGCPVSTTTTLSSPDLFPDNIANISWSWHPVVNTLTPAGLTISFSNAWLRIGRELISMFGKDISIEGYAKTVTVRDFDSLATTQLPLPYASSQLPSLIPTPTMPMAQSHHSTFKIGRLMFSYGGVGTLQADNQMWTYHVDLYEWNLIGSISNSTGLWPPFTQSDVIVADVSGSHIYQYGGGIDYQPGTTLYYNLPSMHCTNHLYQFNTLTHTWTNLTTLVQSNTPWSNSTTAAATGGYISNGYLYPRPRCGAEGVILGDSGFEELYIFGGILDETTSTLISSDNALWKLTLQNLSWSLIQSSDRTISWSDRGSSTQPAGRKYHNLLRLNSNEFFLGFGSDWRLDDQSSFVYFSSSWIFNRQTNRWRFLSDEAAQPIGPPPRSLAAAALYEPIGLNIHAIIVNGGSNSVTPNIFGNFLFVFNLDTGLWSRITPSGTPPTARSSHTIVALNHVHELLLYGGSDTDQAVHVLHMDDIFTAGGSQQMRLMNGTLTHDWLAPLQFALAFDAAVPFGPSVTLSPQPFAFRTLAAAITYVQSTISAENAIITILDTETQFSTDTSRYLSSATIFRNLTLTGTNSAVLVCDANTNLDCSFAIDTKSSDSSCTTTTKLVQLQDFAFLSGHSSYKGGGMLIQNSHVVLTNVDIMNSNATSFGGALAIENSDVTLVGCNLFNNVAGEVGGGIYSLNSNVDISSSSISQNRIAVSSTPLNGQGGGIGMVSTSLTVTDSVFESNQAKYGGGIFASALQSQIIGTFAASIGLRDATFNIHNTTFKGNQALNDGGALYLSLLEDSLTVPFIESCNFTWNTAGLTSTSSSQVYHGGAIYLVSSRLVSNYSVFTANGCTGGGGAVYWSLSGLDTSAITGPSFYPPLSADTNTSSPLTQLMCPTNPFSTSYSVNNLVSDASCNSGSYGPTIASSAASLRFPSDGATAGTQLQSSGATVSPPIKLHIIDIYGQRVTTDNSRAIFIDPPTAFSGATSERAVAGEVIFDALTLKIAPNSSVAVNFTATPDLSALSQDIVSGLLNLNLDSKTDRSSCLSNTDDNTFAQSRCGCSLTCTFDLPRVIGSHYTSLQLIFDTNHFKHRYDQLVVSYQDDASTDTQIFTTIFGSDLGDTNKVDLQIPSGKITLQLSTGDDALGYVVGAWNYTSTCPEGLQLHQASDRCLEVVESSIVARGIIIALAGLTLIGLAYSAHLLLRYRAAPIFRAAGRTFSGITLGLLVLLPIASILFSLVPAASSDAVCITRVWFGSMPIIGILAILFAKSLRVVTIAKSGLRTKMHQRHLWYIVATALAIQLGFCIGFSVMPLSKSELYLHHHSGSSDQLVRQCSIESDFSTWFGIQIGYLGLLCIGAAYISFEARAVPSQFNESTHVANALFMLILVAVILIPVGVLVQDQPDAMVIIQGGGAVFIAFMWTIVLFVPKFWHVHQSLILHQKQLIARRKAEEQAIITAAAMKIGGTPPNQSGQQPQMLKYAHENLLGQVQPAAAPDRLPSPEPNEVQEVQMAKLASALAEARDGVIPGGERAASPGHVISFHISHPADGSSERPVEPERNRGKEPLSPTAEQQMELSPDIQPRVLGREDPDHSSAELSFLPPAANKYAIGEGELVPPPGVHHAHQPVAAAAESSSNDTLAGRGLGGIISSVGHMNDQPIGGSHSILPFSPIVIRTNLPHLPPLSAYLPITQPTKAATGPQLQLAAPPNTVRQLNQQTQSTKPPPSPQPQANH